MEVGAVIGIAFGIFFFTLIVTGIVTFLITRRMFLKQLRENPPINEKMIRAMFMQMGRKPSEAQIKSVMRSMQNAKQNPN